MGQPGRAQRLLHGHVHGVELVVASHLLDWRPATHVLEHDEVADKREESFRLEHTPEQHPQLRQAGRRIFAPGYRSPGLEPFAPGADGTDARLHAVGDSERCVGGEERRDLGLISLKLLKRIPDGSVLVCRVLELDDAKRQPVHE